MMDDEWIAAGEACRLLGVRAQTLYAYASRGLLRAVADSQDARRSLYHRDEVEELAARKGRSRKLADVASAAIAWGEPVLELAITTVREGRFTYRGIDAVTLSERATLEQVAGLLTGIPHQAPLTGERLPVPDFPRAKAGCFGRSPPGQQRPRRWPEPVPPSWEKRRPCCSTLSPMPQRGHLRRV